MQAYASRGEIHTDLTPGIHIDQRGRGAVPHTSMKPRLPRCDLFGSRILTVYFVPKRLVHVQVSVFESIDKAGSQ